MPSFGLGTWKIPKDIAATVVYDCIKSCGLRHIDCACDYGNEVEVGQGIKKAIDEGIVKREELWITSKLWNTYHAPEHVELACKKTLEDLGLDYLDLYLIHFPISLKFVPIETRYPPEWLYDPTLPQPKIEEVKEPLSGTWSGMEGLVDKGLTKRIGVSNFNVQKLMELLSFCRIPPYANQVELHPYLQQPVLVEWCNRHDILLTGFSCIGAPSYGQGPGALADPVIVDIAKKNNKTPVQVMLRWNLQRGVAAVIPKSNSLERNKENFLNDGFTLSDEDMTRIAKLDKNLRYNDPGVFCKGMGSPLSQAIPIYN